MASSNEPTPIVSVETFGLTATGNTTAAGSTAPTGTAASGFVGAITSPEELRTKYPELYKAMMEGMAQQICRRMKESQDRIHKMNREAQSH